jgi:hypothetical protein
VASPVTMVGRISEGLTDVGRIASGETLKIAEAAE